jgi:hypothetical protein
LHFEFIVWFWDSSEFVLELLVIRMFVEITVEIGCWGVSIIFILVRNIITHNNFLDTSIFVIICIERHRNGLLFISWSISNCSILLDWIICSNRGYSDRLISVNFEMSTCLRFEHVCIALQSLKKLWIVWIHFFFNFIYLHHFF